jgi:Ca2+/Na+ antiporter
MSAVGLFSFVPILLIILIIFIVAGVKNETKKGGGEDVIKNIYIYLVLFATLMMTIGGSVGAFMAIADIVAPAPYYQTFEEYRLRDVEKYGIAKEEVDGVENEEVSEEELRERYDAIALSHKQNQVDRAKNSLVKSFGWIVIPLPVFMFFQRRLGKKEE